MRADDRIVVTTGATAHVHSAIVGQTLNNLWQPASERRRVRHTRAPTHAMSYDGDLVNLSARAAGSTQHSRSPAVAAEHHHARAVAF